VAAHLVAAGFFWWSPLPDRAALLPAVVNVTLVAAPPGAPVAQPEAPVIAEPPPPPPPPLEPVPAAEPVPAPVAVPKPVPEKVLLPKEATKVPKPEPKPAPQAKPKPKPAPARPPEPVAYDDVLSQLRAEAGEATPQPVKVAARPTPQPAGGGLGIPISAEEVAWRRRVKVQVTRAWVLEPGLQRELLETEVRVKIAAGGEVKSVDVTRKSGNPYYDDSVVRAVEKSSPLPAPSEADAWRFVFTPQDLL
jgi:colicin import membrane protein